MATWSSAQVQPARTGVSATGFANQTVRQIVHISIGGSQVRLQLSNLYGTAPIRVESAQLGVSESGASIVGGTNRPVTVGQSASFVLPAGGEVLTDPIALPVAAGANLAVSLYFAAPTGPTTWHPVALTTSYVAAGIPSDGGVLVLSERRRYRRPGGRRGGRPIWRLHDRRGAFLHQYRPAVGRRPQPACRPKRPGRHAGHRQ